MGPQLKKSEHNKENDKSNQQTVEKGELIDKENLKIRKYRKRIILE